MILWEKNKIRFIELKNQILGLNNSYSLNLQSYNEHLREFNLGLISNIEVTRALDELIESEKLWHSSRFDLVRLWYDMKIFVGDLEL
jgi:hypothetical protein